jgi:8-oxo-dGTP pyrophosphatase MutT (NUDIX family)
LHPIFRKPLHYYWRMTRGLTLGVRAIVVDEGERVFLVKHTYTSGWHFPGGGVEPGECAADALRRELQEEAGIAPRQEPRLYGVFFNRAVSRRDHVIVYRIDDFEVLDFQRPGLEIAEAGFFPIADPPADINAGTLRRLRELTGAAPPGSDW